VGKQGWLRGGLEDSRRNKYSKHNTKYPTQPTINASNHDEEQSTSLLMAHHWKLRIKHLLLRMKIF
jgi:hypothetical protein